MAQTTYATMFGLLWPLFGTLTERRKKEERKNQLTSTRPVGFAAGKNSNQSYIADWLTVCRQNLKLMTLKIPNSNAMRGASEWASSHLRSPVSRQSHSLSWLEVTSLSSRTKGAYNITKKLSSISAISFPLPSINMEIKKSSNELLTSSSIRTKKYTKYSRPSFMGIHIFGLLIFLPAWLIKCLIIY